MERIYVCHTYYHVLISIVKEMNRVTEKSDKRTLLISRMSTDFEELKERVERSGFFDTVIDFDEKRDSYFPELMELKKDRGSSFLNLFNRIKYTKLLSKFEEPYVPVDFKKYDDIYVFCDGDPIGTYLNQHKIKYHAVEDGLDTLKPLVQAKFDNKGLFKLKKFFSMRLNLIFMCDGYSKYCIDMEVNDKTVIDDDFYKYVEIPRAKLFDALSKEQIQTIQKIFVKDADKLKTVIEKCDEKKAIMILTEPLCSLDVRKNIFSDLINEYSKEGMVVLKPHPRDELNYESEFPDVLSFDRTVPMEIFRINKNIKFSKIISVYTQLANVDFAEEKVFLGHDFMDKYEDPKIHRKTI